MTILYHLNPPFTQSKDCSVMAFYEQAQHSDITAAKLRFNWSTDLFYSCKVPVDIIP
jgi:hypothetical protein